MLNKIVKLIGIGVIIGLNGFMLADEEPEFVEDEDGNLLGIRLHLPQELIQDCEDKYWEIHDKALRQKLEDIVLTEKNFHIWCNQQEIFNDCNPIKFRDSIKKFAYIIKRANQKGYYVPGNFCRQIKLKKIFVAISMKNLLCRFPDPNNPTEQYLRKLECLIEYNF